jgi:hypothetical protein
MGVVFSASSFRPLISSLVEVCRRVPELLDGRKRVKKPKEEVEMYPSPRSQCPSTWSVIQPRERGKREAEEENKKQYKGAHIRFDLGCGRWMGPESAARKTTCFVLVCLLSSILN